MLEAGWDIPARRRVSRPRRPFFGNLGHSTSGCIVARAASISRALTSHRRREGDRRARRASCLDFLRVRTPLSRQPVGQLGQRPELPIRAGRSRGPLALPVDPGHRDAVRDGRRHVVEVALRSVKPAPGADPVSRGGEVSRSRLVGSDLLRGHEQREASCWMSRRCSSSTPERPGVTSRCSEVERDIGVEEVRDGPSHARQPVRVGAKQGNGSGIVVGRRECQAARRR